MADAEVPTMEVGFAIDTGGSFSELIQLQEVMNSTEARVFADAAKIEKATAGMVNVDRAIGGITSFGNAVTREAQTSARELAKIEKSGQSLVFQLEKQNASFGKTREEMRAMKVEAAALAAEQQGLHDLAARLRTAEAALYEQEFAAMRRQKAEVEALAEDKALAAQRAVAAAETEAQANRAAALAYQMFEARAREGTAALREQEAAALRDANAVAQLRAMLDPAAAEQARLNTQVEEARRVMLAAGASGEELARVEQLLTKRHGEGKGASDAHRAAVQNLGFQLQDFSVQVVGGTSALRAFAMQAPQATGALSGFEGKLGTVGRYLNSGWGIAITLAVTLLAGFADKLLETGENAEKAADGLKKFQDRQSDIGNFIDATTGRLTEQNRTLLLNAVLTRQAQIAANEKAMAETRTQAFDRARQSSLQTTRAAPGTTTSGVSFTDNVDVQKVIKDAGGDVAKLADGLAALAKRRPELTKVALDVSGIGGQAILAARENANLRKELQALGGDTKALATGTASLIEKQVALATATTPLERARAQLSLVQQGAAAADKAGGAALDKYRADLTGATKAVHEAEAAQRAANSARRDARRDANHADQLGREAAAIEAQVRNLYNLADAYGVSGAAALIAEARVKAESQAIKQRADVEAGVDRQVRLMIAQRISDGSKMDAAQREQVQAQETVNAMVAAGNVAAERAAELLRDRIADLPLLAAIEAAQQRGLATEASKATKVLEEQRAARERARTASIATQFNGDSASMRDQLAMLEAEGRLITANDAVRAHELATLRALQEAKAKQYDPAQTATYLSDQVKIADAIERNRQAQDSFNASLSMSADRWSIIASNVDTAARGIADAFGSAGEAIGNLASIYAGFHADRARLDQQHLEELRRAGSDKERIEQANAKYALSTATSQIGLYGDMSAAAKGFFKEGADGYKAMATAEKAFRAIEFALSLKAMAQDAIETGASLAKSGARTAAKAVEAVVSAISSLPFPLNLAAGAATIAALASIGVAIAGSFGGGGNNLPKANEGTGTVLGDVTAKSDSIKRSIDSLKEVDTLMLNTSRDMAASLRSIESQIGGFAALVLRTGDINASEGIGTGFKQDATGKLLEGLITGGGIVSKIPIIGGIIGGIGSLIGSLFGTKTKVVGSGLYGGSQSVADILSGGFDADYYSDVQKKKKFFGLTTSTKYSTQFADADPELENQFTLILRQFNNAIVAAAGPLGVATQDIQNRLNGFVVSIGKIDLQGLTGEEIEEKLTAVFGAAADDMAKAAFPGIERFQQVGEGLFDTLVRVASTVESVTSSLTMLGSSASLMSIDLKMALADQFDSVSDFSNAVDGYFETYYTKAEQAAARTAQFTDVFDSLGLSMPTTLAAFRALVDAQDLTTAAGQATYATLLQLAPAFADLQSAMNGAKSAADILSEREDLQRQLLEAQGDTAAIRALELAALDESNRALQEQIWAVQDAKEAADAAEQLKDAWTSVGDSIMDEVNRIRGITDGTGSGSFATLMGQFNSAVAAAKGGDQDAASSLPGLSQSLLQGAELAATSRQELDRVKAQTAASLESVYAAIMAANGAASGTGVATGVGAPTGTILSAAATAAKVSTGASDSSADMVAEIKALRAEVAQLRADNNSGHAATASNTGAIKRKFEDVTADSGGNAITVTGVAA